MTAISGFTGMQSTPLSVFCGFFVGCHGVLGCLLSDNVLHLLLRFVGLVRSKTPKLTLYTRRAKCMLMENCPIPDFEAIFYDGECFPGSAHVTVVLQASSVRCTLKITAVSFQNCGGGVCAAED